MNYEEVTRLAFERGFFFPSSEIYAGAPAGFWEYGPLGAALKNRFVNLWRRELLRRDGIIEIDGSQIMTRKVFVASGHLDSFADPMVSCKQCRSVYRADKLIEERTGTHVPEKLSDDSLNQIIQSKNVTCPNCDGSLGSVSRFNMMFRLGVGAGGEEAFLRPETCQSIFLDFSRTSRIMRLKLPARLAQYGKSFRNEISPRQALIRLRELYQAEIEIFYDPTKTNDFDGFEEISAYELNLKPLGREQIRISCKDALGEKILPSKMITYYLALLWQFYEKAGLRREKIRLRQLSEAERAFYSLEAWDLEAQTSVGWTELVACNNRGDYDLSRHSSESGQELSIDIGGRRVLPHIFELSMGVDRSLYCILEHCLERESERDVLRLPAYLAPVQVAVFALVDKDGLPDIAKKIFADLKLDFDAVYDESGSIGRRYRRQDEIGTPFCVTIDYQTVEDKTVTVRERDSMTQERVLINQLGDFLRKNLIHML